MDQHSSPYSGLARIYDQIMAGVDYEAWADYVLKLVENSGKKPGSVIDLACGTGSSTLPFAAKGYKTAGVDFSPAMLKAARKKALQAGLQIDFAEQDLRSLALPEQYDLAVLFQDGLNYLLNREELLSAFKGVFAQLNPGSLFIFDLTRPGQRPESKQGIQWIDLDDFSIIWKSSYDNHNTLWSVTMTLFCKAESGLYEKYTEKHREKDYEPEEVSELLAEAGFKDPDYYPSFSFEPAAGNEHKLTFVVEKG